MSKDHDWQYVPARTPSGKTRMVRQCSVCKLITYSQGRLSVWKYADGRIAETATVEAPSCDGRPSDRE